MWTFLRRILVVIACFGGVASFALAQSQPVAKVAFGGIKGDPDLPVTVTSQVLTVDQERGTALFSGDVLVVQGEMRLSASEVRVEYDETGSRVQRLWATGDVLLVNAQDAASAQTAEYVIDDGKVTMRGDVTLTQGAATFSAQQFVADLVTGVGQLEGGVTSVFDPAAAQAKSP